MGGVTVMVEREHRAPPIDWRRQLGAVVFWWRCRSIATPTEQSSNSREAVTGSWSFWTWRVVLKRLPFFVSQLFGNEQIICLKSPIDYFMPKNRFFIALNS